MQLPAADPGTVDQTRSKAAAGAVFVATNDANANAVIMYRRAADGTLTRLGQFATGGRGEGGINDPLQSSESLILSSDHSFLLVVNSGSSDISVFRVRENGLNLLSVTPSGGGNPVSLALHDDLLYVLNFGGSSTHTAGFRLAPWGELSPIAGSRQTLSSLDTEPSTIVFSPDGTKLAVSERQTNNIDIFDVNPSGSISPAVITKGTGKEPFGIAFTGQDILLVTNAQDATLTSYRIQPDDTVLPITAGAPAGGGATCWVASDGQHVWVTNTLGSSIGSFAIDSSGTLTPTGLVSSEPAAAKLLFPPLNVSTAFPIDLRLTSDNQFLYVVYSVNGTLAGYKVINGKLTQVDTQRPFRSGQIGVAGLAAY